MEDARKLCASMQVADSARVKCLGLLDSRCILHLCKKGWEAERRNFDSLSEVADAFVTELSAITDTPIKDAFGKVGSTPGAAALAGAAVAAPRAAASAAAPKDKVKVALHAAASVADLKDKGKLAARAGFVPGAVVRTKKQSGTFTIKAVSDGTAELAMANSSDTKSVDLDDLLAKYRIHKGTETRECAELSKDCLLYTSPSPRDATLSRMPSSA